MDYLIGVECKVRGCITRGDFNDICHSIEKDWGRFDEGFELVIFFKKDYDLRLNINKKGCILSAQKNINKRWGIKQKTEFLFTIDEVPKIINLLNQIGFTKGLFSPCYRYDASKSNRFISFKFDTKIGDLFELGEVINNKKSFSGVYHKLLNLTHIHTLNPWAQEIYRKIIKNSWEGAEEEFLLINNKLHPLIQKAINKSECKKIISPTNQSISSILKNKSNDYTKLEKIFKKSTKTELLNWKPGSLNNYKETVSIIIPTFNSLKTLKLTLHSVEGQKINRSQKKYVEVIVIDDGSTDGTEKFLENKNFSFKFRYIKQNNLGRVYARNLGASIAIGNILIFIDADVILDKYFLNEHIRRHHYLDNIIVVSFKENISPKEKLIKDVLNGINLQRPNITKDFRFEKTVQKEWLRMHRHVRNIEVRNIKIIKETNNFKEFGEDRILGVWDLPAMVVTCAVSLKRKSFKNIGGFNLQFKGWGMEDTFMGACLIANGDYVIPCFSTGVFHINHTAKSKSKQSKISEFNRNVLVYLDLINKPIYEVFKERYY
ncbi:MAG: glycosyltransferase [bacterium]|nr:glycosyltransferase [bacterium]